ncbi:MAG: trimethylamine corrinoid protein 2 [Velocimicrobium sp.]
MKYKKNWEETKIKWENYWKRENTGRPLMCVVANNEDKRDLNLEEKLKPVDMEDKYMNAERMVERFRYYGETHDFLGESFPNISLDFGPGSMAGYVGCEIVFNEDTVWFDHFVEDWEEYKDIAYDSENKWLKKHLKLFEDVRKLIGDEFLIGIPDIMENVDVLASMRGVQDLIFDMVDEPEEVQRRLDQIQAIYFDYYNQFYDIVKGIEGDSCYTVFQIWGPGKTAKIQCDFSALMSPNQFREFVQEELRKQAKQLDHVLYHLDGPDAIKHLDAIMEIDEIDALQWTSGDHGPDGTMVEWYPIYDKAVAAGKGLWIKVYSGTLDEWIERVEKLVYRYGSNAMFLYFPEMPLEDAQRLIAYADEHWSDIEGDYVKELKAQR